MGCEQLAGARMADALQAAFGKVIFGQRHGARVGIRVAGDLHARLYEKVIEIANRSSKTYLFGLWQTKGWQMGEKVWRMEFQTEKQTLKELGIISLSGLQGQQSALWHYLTRWLRLSIPNLHDSKRDRWPIAPAR